MAREINVEDNVDQGRHGSERVPVKAKRAGERGGEAGKSPLGRALGADLQKRIPSNRMPMRPSGGVNPPQYPVQPRMAVPPTSMAPHMNMPGANAVGAPMNQPGGNALIAHVLRMAAARNQQMGGR